MPIISTDKKITAFPRIKIIACIGIILLHTLFASNVYFEKEMTQTDTLITKSIENLLMWAVPCFLMVTGALLLDPGREISLKKLYGKYVRRMVLALVIFTFLFCVLDILMEGKALTVKSVIPAWLHQLFTSESWAHMWYLYMMIGIYVLLPFYKVIVKNCSNKMLVYLCIVYAIFISVLPITEIFGAESGFYISTTVIYPLYLFLGYILHKNPIGKGAGWILFLGCTVTLAVLTVFRYTYGDLVSFDLDAFDKLFGYSSILVIIQSIGVFMIMDGDKRENGHKVLFGIDGCVFGIYLIHMIFVKYLMSYKGFDPYKLGTEKMLIAFGGMVITFFFLSLVVTWALRKIPKVNFVL